MKLYYKPGACSLASHIVLHEAGITCELDRVDTGAGKTEQGHDFSAINPNGYVPALELEEGEILTEGAAILQYLADKFPSAQLAPQSGTLERAQMQQHLNFVASELHKAFSPFFAKSPPQGAAKDTALSKLDDKMRVFDDHFSDGRVHLLGQKFSVADAYLFVVANWSNFLGIDLTQWPNVSAFVNRVAARPATQAAMRAEGLI